MTQQAHGIGQRHVSKKTTVERYKKMTGAGREDTESKNM